MRNCQNPDFHASTFWSHFHNFLHLILCCSWTFLVAAVILKRGKDKNVACMLYTIYFSLTLFLFVGFVGCGVGWLMILNPVTILKMLVGQTLCLTNSASCCNSLIHECGLWTLCSNNLCSYPQLVCRGAISVLTLILLVAEAGCPNNCTQLCSLLTGYNRPA